MTPPPKLSVCMLTYNQEDYIAQAIDSALMQKVDFDYEIVIGEDCSTDRTREIVYDYHSRYPARIRVLAAPANIGAKQNFLRTFSACRGEYLAFLEGDDYWTTPDKLQLQVDFLDARPAFSLCGHHVRRVGDDGRELDRFPATTQQDFTFRDLIAGNFLPTCSVVLRKGLAGPLPDWFSQCVNGDWPLFLLCAHSGPVHLMADVMGVYRVHEDGLWSALPQLRRLEHSVQTLDLVRRHFGEQYDTHFLDTLARFHFDTAWFAADDGDRARAFRALRDLFGTLRLRRRPPALHMAALGVKLCSPALFRTLDALRKWTSKKV